MNTIHPIVQKWINCWRTGNIEDLPITDDFCHTSPFGVIDSKAKYLDIVGKNKKDFLGNQLIVLKQIQQGNSVCVQFEQKNANTGLDMMVCEWYELQDNKIKAIRSFYNIGNAEIKG